MKRLHLLRHAKSSWGQSGLDDLERPLNTRGRTAARHLAAWLAEHDVRPELVLCSTALRTRQTLELVLPALGEPDVVHESALYGASVGELLQRVHELDTSLAPAHPPDEVLLVGHNPGVHELALLLAAPSTHRDRIAAKLPTGALVTLELGAGRWEHAAAGEARIVALVLPRELGG